MELLKTMDNPYQLKRLCPNWIKRISLLLCRKQQVSPETQASPKNLEVAVSVTDTAQFKALLKATWVLLSAAQFCEVGYGSPTAGQAKEEAIALLKEAGIAVEER